LQCLARLALPLSYTVRPPLFNPNFKNKSFVLRQAGAFFMLGLSRLWYLANNLIEGSEYRPPCLEVQAFRSK
jgi:hypothetical protein